jgi:hypothetical protein
MIRLSRTTIVYKQWNIRITRRYDRFQQQGLYLRSLFSGLGDSIPDQEKDRFWNDFLGILCSAAGAVQTARSFLQSISFREDFPSSVDAANASFAKASWPLMTARRKRTEQVPVRRIWRRADVVDGRRLCWHRRAANHRAMACRMAGPATH